MKLWAVVVIVACVACVVFGQQNNKKKSSDDKKGDAKLKDGQFLKKSPVQNGPDGRPLLFAPKIELCKNSKY